MIMEKQVPVHSDPKSSMMLRSFEDYEKFATKLSRSGLVPKDYMGRPDDILICMQFGSQIGLAPMQSLQNIASIRGRPCLYGDAMLALVQSSNNFESIEETIEGETAICKLKRKGSPMAVRKFSMDDARRANLTNSPVWKSYPKRMLQMRARAFACRDLFADVLNGMQCVEEAKDIDYINSDSSSSGSDLDDLKNILSKKKESPGVIIEAEYDSLNEVANCDIDMYCDTIRNCKDMDDLKSTFSNVWREAKEKGLLSSELKAISNEKDEVKMYLKNKAISQAAKEDKEVTVS